MCRFHHGSAVTALISLRPDQNRRPKIFLSESGSALPRKLHRYRQGSVTNLSHRPRSSTVPVVLYPSLTEATRFPTATYRHLLIHISETKCFFASSRSLKIAHQVMNEESFIRQRISEQKVPGSFQTRNTCVVGREVVGTRLSR